MAGDLIYFSKPLPASPVPIGEREARFYGQIRQVSSDPEVIPVEVPRRWTHRDPEMWIASERAIARSEWTSGTLERRAAELRALLVRSLAAASDMSTTVATTTASGVLMVPDPVGLTFVDDDHADLAAAIVDAWAALVPPDEQRPIAEDIATQAGGSDAAAFQVAVIVGIVACAAVYGGVIAYVAHEAAAVVDHQLARITQTQQLVAQTGAITRMAEAHAAAEQAVGHSLPMSDVQRTAIAALSQAAQTVAKRKIPTVGDGSSSMVPIALAVGGVVVGGAVVYYLIKGK